MNKMISRNDTKVTGPKKIAGLAYDSQPGWSGILLRASAVTWQLSQNPNLFPSHGSILSPLTEGVRRCKGHKTQLNGRRSSYGG